VVGGGVRSAPEQLELFEVIINLVRRCAPGAGRVLGVSATVQH